MSEIIYSLEEWAVWFVLLSAVAWAFSFLADKNRLEGQDRCGSVFGCCDSCSGGNDGKNKKRKLQIKQK